LLQSTYRPFLCDVLAAPPQSVRLAGDEKVNNQGVNPGAYRPASHLYPY
jgi:hypothetical protein